MPAVPAAAQCQLGINPAPTLSLLRGGEKCRLVGLGAMGSRMVEEPAMFSLKYTSESVGQEPP